MKTMPLKWVIEHQFPFARALMFVMMDLTNEVSAGTVDSAKETLEKLIRQCNTKSEKVMYWILNSFILEHTNLTKAKNKFNLRS